MDDVHCFEKAGLGRAPFYCVGMASIPSASLAEANPVAYNNALAMLPRDVGGCGSCAYCGTAIMHNFIIKSSDGRRFVVGSDCVARTGDAGLIKAVRGERLKVVREKREAGRRLKREEREALWKRQREEQAVAFRVHNAALIEKAAPWMALSPFIKDVIERGLAGGYISDKAYLAVEKSIADLEERARLRACSSWVGTVGKRETFKVKVQRVNYFDRPCYGAEWKRETVWVVTMRDAAGNAIVVKSTAFRPQEGAELTIKATIKDHSEYRGEKQTLVQRVKEC